ncbi:MAG: DnaJ domain-containing protein [Benjaminiella poitrasii]|nr:MAG: DnaJ domain-containing protein [Benjaminiella poitrasii]
MSFHSTCFKRFFSHVKKTRNPYEVLRLTESATQTEIKKRYKELAKELHPDKKTTGNLAKFQELVQAYEFLTASPHKRHYYHNNAPPPGNRPPSYTNAYWYEPPLTTTKYTTNTTFLSILAGIVIAIGTLNLFYFQSSHGAFIDAANQHHRKSSEDLKRARTEAKLFGNDRGVKRVIETRMNLFRNKKDNDDDNKKD